MCAEIKNKKRFSVSTYFALATLFGIVAGVSDSAMVYSLADLLSTLFINLLKLVSVPIIFLSIVSTAGGMENVHEVKALGKRVIKYTLLTTIIAALVALIVFLAIDPVKLDMSTQDQEVPRQTISYTAHLLKTIPSNIVQPFSENNVVGVLIIAIMLSLSILALPDHNRKTLHHVFSSLYAAVMKLTVWIVQLMPIAVWAFIVLFIKDFKNGLELKSLALYLTCVLVANLIQALVVLPLFLKWKGISPLRLIQGMFPALSIAFFTKSSAAAIPMAMRCAEENVKMSPKVASFCLPLCTTINMNACAAFILTTVLFVSMSNGMTYSPVELFAWIFIATVAALGNAGVPMGCFFLSTAFLAAMNVPLNILGVILPFYTLIDMFESAINVWSDSCVTAVVDREVADAEANNASKNGIVQPAVNIHSCPVL